MSAIRALVAMEGGVTAAAVESALPGADGIEVLHWVPGAAVPIVGSKEAAADIVLVACSAKSAAALPLIEQAVDRQPDRPVVVLQLDGSESNGFMQQVFAAGADDIIVLPETPERIRHGLQKAIARKRGATLAQGAVPAGLLCLLGPKGGTGKTVTAINLAVALAEQGVRVGLVDLDLRFGDVALGLRLPPERTIYDLARSGGTLDAEKLEDYLARHASGLRTLIAPTRPDQAGTISTGFIAELLAVLRSMSDIVIVDTPAGFAPEVITTIDSSTDVCAIAMLDAFSLKDTKLGLETLDRMGYDRSAIRIVLNRADTHVGIAQEDVKVILGRTPDILVPSQRDIPRTVTQGVPIVSSQPKSPAAKAFKCLARLYASELKQSPPSPAEPSHQARRGLLRRT